MGQDLIQTDRDTYLKVLSIMGTPRVAKTRDTPEYYERAWYYKGKLFCATRTERESPEQLRLSGSYSYHIVEDKLHVVNYRPILRNKHKTLG